MNSLLPLMRESKALGIDQPLHEGNVNDALQSAFTVLTGAFGLTLNSSTPVFFSCDADEIESSHGLIFHEDQFAAQVMGKIGTPYAKICHMRLYATEEGAHWHSLFAEMDEQGYLKKIIITDSRVRDQVGITAHRDIENNPFLQECLDKIEFIPGASQPIGIHICWIYCLANLASLAATGKVYEPKTQSLGEELATIITEATKPKAPPPPKLELALITKEVKQEAHSPTPPKTEQSEASPSQVQPFTLFTPRTPLITEDREKETPEIKERVISTPNFYNSEKPTASQSTSSLKWLGGGALLLGAGALVVAGLALTPLLPISFPLSMALISAGIVLALAGVVMLIADKICQSHMKLDKATESALIF
ncbi:hypothetical protein [Legionella brunensis]|uniref:Uncharacterized protein n=1 Tax=Legionella brunensis TaxID=29422 RepID=A0A0W0S4S1_9GAMM|nr:hypothetical protein [Legionella brunensis]KTC78187.1 hypothetical protein Lbru_2479 [Legionella brunensis]